MKLNCSKEIQVYVVTKGKWWAFRELMTFPAQINYEVEIIKNSEALQDLVAYILPQSLALPNGVVLHLPGFPVSKEDDLGWAGQLVYSTPSVLYIEVQGPEDFTPLKVLAE